MQGQGAKLESPRQVWLWILCARKSRRRPGGGSAMCPCAARVLTEMAAMQEMPRLTRTPGVAGMPNGAECAFPGRGAGL